MYELLALAKRDGCCDIRIIATSAVREADNSVNLIGAFSQEVEILSGDDEACLAFDGVMSSSCLAGTPALVLDVSGGSTEFIVGDPGGCSFTRACCLARCA